MPNRETPTNYVDAELLHTASTEYAITRISAFQSPQKNKKNLSTPKPPTTMISKARHTARPYTLYRRPCTEARADAVRLSHMDKLGVQFTGTPSHPHRARHAARPAIKNVLVSPRIGCPGTARAAQACA